MPAFALIVMFALYPTPLAHADIAPQQDYSTTTLKAYAETVAQDDGLNVREFVGTIQCESGFSFNARGDRGTSLGIAQLHYPSRDWGISTSTAFDPYASINLMARAWQNGEQGKWSCFRLLYR